MWPLYWQGSRGSVTFDFTQPGRDPLASCHLALMRRHQSATAIHALLEMPAARVLELQEYLRVVAHRLLYTRREPNAMSITLALLRERIPALDRRLAAAP